MKEIVIVPARQHRSRPSRLKLSTLDNAVADGRHATTLRVLVVDDCPFQRLFTSLLLSRWGIRAEVASDGVEAVLMAGESKFDLILMDIQMEGLDGVAATARIRQNERRRRLPEVPIVAYTAESVVAKTRAWPAAGITASLAKPCDSAAMGRCLEQWCGFRTETFQH
jgi:CheY-like chemotaxis protein